MMLHSLPSRRIPLVACVVALTWAATGFGCGDDQTLGQSFVPREQSTEDEDLGEKSPIVVGTELWYNLAASFRRTTTSNAGGLISGEAQSGGAMCLKITAVQDTATPAYASQPSTVVVAKVKVSASDGSDSNLQASDQANPSATPQQVDSLLQPLWIKRLTVPSAGHGFGLPKDQNFVTQSAPTPATGMQALPFFEVRTLEKLGWSGWEYSDAMPQGRNFINGVLQYFLAAPYGQTFFVDRTRFRYTTVTPPTSCEQYTDARSCGVAQCRWAVPPGGNMSQCLSLYSVRLLWRETLTTPAEIAGPVVHQIEVLYNHAGVLATAAELIVPDTGGDLPSELTGCGSKCMNASVVNVGGWGDSQSGAPCRF